MKRFDYGLTEKESIFCEEYITDLDGTKAAIRAGYSEGSAKSIAYHLRQRPQVEAYICELLEKRSLRLRITADEVLMELARIAFSEPSPQTPAEGIESEQTADSSLTEEDKVEKAAGEAPEAPKPRYNSATMYRVTEVDPVTGRRTVRWFNLTAKIAALKLLGWHLGLFKDKKGLPKRMNVILPRTDDYVPIDKRAA